MRLVPTCLLLSLCALAACNTHVFVVVEKACSNEIIVESDVGTSAPLDLLVVVDNSGSMLEEQQNLRDNFYDPRCPFLTPEVPEVPEAERNPTEARLRELEEVCGFIQILGAFDRDFRIGVITTDMTECDDRFGQAPPGRERRPQRGCLQPANDGRRVLVSGDAGNEEAFQQMLDGIGTWGSPVERGLDAVVTFLDPTTERHEECAFDLESFLRPEADLAVILLTDENDCSYGGPLGEGAPMLDDSAVFACDASADDPIGTLADASACYDEGTALTEVSFYAERLRALKKDKAVQVAVIGGALLAEDGAYPAGCLTTSGVPEGQCYPSKGLSNDERLCGEEARAGLEPCCEADAAHRYFALEDSLGQAFFGDSICFESFRSTLVRLAEFIGRTDSLRLEEPPVNPDAILVRVKRAGSDEEVALPRLDENDAPEEKDGWWYAGEDEIRFAGPSAPGPGDIVTVSVLTTRDVPSDCVAATGPVDEE